MNIYIIFGKRLVWSGQMGLAEITQYALSSPQKQTATKSKDRHNLSTRQIKPNTNGGARACCGGLRPAWPLPQELWTRVLHREHWHE